MKIITLYEAPDKSRFNTKTECEEYEHLCNKIAHVMAVLPKRPNDIDYANGHGFIQHESDTIAVVKKGLLQIFSTKIDHKWIKQSMEATVHPSYVGRIVDDSGITCFYHAWHRIQCIDREDREWGQPYYAMHPNEAKQVMLNA